MRKTGIWKRVEDEIPQDGREVLVSDGQIGDPDGVAFASYDHKLGGWHDRNMDILPWVVCWADIPEIDIAL